MDRRGREFAQAAYHNFGPVQLEDQLTVLDAVLAQYPQPDKKRLGWWGWSWAAPSRSMRYPTPTVSAPGCGSSGDRLARLRLDLYRALYEPAGGVCLRIPRLLRGQFGSCSQGHLLLAQGTGDDNVHMENMVQYVQTLIEAGKPYDLQIYPRKTHSIAGPDVRVHLYNRILAHFEEYLKPPWRNEADDRQRS